MLLGMGFFDQVPPPPPEEVEPPAPPPPPWAKPETVLGGAVAEGFVLARSADAVVAVSGLVGFPGGFLFTVTVVLRSEDRRGHLFQSAFDRGWPVGDESPGPEFLRVGVQFADGAAVTNLGGAWPPPGAEPAGPLLQHDGGGGGGRRYDMSYWVWPLPPPGPLTFVCEWPSHGIGETRAEIDARLIHDAAARAVELWP